MRARGTAHRNLRRFVHILACLSLLHVTACGHWSRPPRKWAPPAKESQREAFGGWIRVETEESDDKVSRFGELIAVHPDSLYILGVDGVEAVATGDVQRAEVYVYNTGYGTAGAWTFVGALSTVSHGFILIVSLPLWILVGSVTTTILAQKGKAKYRAPSPRDEYRRRRHPSKSSDLLDFAKYARFPQGLPPDLDLHGLAPKETDHTPRGRGIRE